MQETLEEQYKQLVKQIKLYANGVVSDSMEEKLSSDFTFNFGVPITSLREFAIAYFPNQVLADKLWKTNIRETKILATLISDINQAGTDYFVPKRFNLEMIEQLAFNYYAKKEGIEALITQFLHSGFEVMQCIAIKVSSILVVRKLLSRDYLDKLLIDLVTQFPNLNLENGLAIYYNFLSNLSYVDQHFQQAVTQQVAHLHNPNQKQLDLLINNLRTALLADN